MSGHPKHLDAIHRRERAQELFKRAQDLAWMGHLPECLNVVEEGLLLHGGCKELLTLKAEVEPRSGDGHPCSAAIDNQSPRQWQAGRERGDVELWRWWL